MDAISPHVNVALPSRAKAIRSARSIEDKKPARIMPLKRIQKSKLGKRLFVSSMIQGIAHQIGTTGNGVQGLDEETAVVTARSGDAEARQQLDKVRQSMLILQFERDSLKETLAQQQNLLRKLRLPNDEPRAKARALEGIEKLAGWKTLATDVDRRLSEAAAGIALCRPN